MFKKLLLLGFCNAFPWRSFCLEAFASFYAYGSMSPCPFFHHREPCGTIHRVSTSISIARLTDGPTSHSSSVLDQTYAAVICFLLAISSLPFPQLSTAVFQHPRVSCVGRCYMFRIFPEFRLFRKNTVKRVQENYWIPDPNYKMAFLIAFQKKHTVHIIVDGLLL